MTEETMLAPLRDITTEQSKAIAQLTQVSAGLSALFQQMDARIRALESDKMQATILHQEALALGKLIRDRAATETERNHLTLAQEKKLRFLIKRTILTQYRIKDLHDLPKLKHKECIGLISAMPVYRLIMKARETHD